MISGNLKPAMIIIITGEKGTGKTTFIMKLSELLKTAGKIGGILTPAVFSAGGKKTGFDALDIASGISWPLGRTEADLGGPVFGPYSFSREGLDRAAAVFKSAVEQNYRYLFLDEIGPLELKKKQGFYPLLQVISGIPDISHLYLVIRPSLVDTFIKEVLPNRKCRIITITIANRDSRDLLKQACGF